MTSFWCSWCKVSHPGECAGSIAAAAGSQAAAKAIGLHDWEKLAVVDLSLRSICRKCFLTHRETVLSTILGGNPNPPPVGGCPGKPPN